MMTSTNVSQIDETPHDDLRQLRTEALRHVYSRSSTMTSINVSQVNETHQDDLRQLRTEAYLHMRLRRIVQAVVKDERRDQLYNKYQYLLVKLTQLTVLVLCWAVFAYQTYDRVLHYFSYPVAVDVSISRSKFQTFPSVAICYQATDDVHQLMDKYNVHCFYVNVMILLKKTHGLSTEEIWNSTNTSRAVISAQEISRDRTFPLGHSDVATVYGICSSFQSRATTMNFLETSRQFQITFKISSHRCSARTMMTFHEPEEDPLSRSVFVIPSNIKDEFVLNRKNFHFVNRRGSPCISSRGFRKCKDDCLSKFIKQAGADKCKFSFYPPQLNTNSFKYCMTSKDTERFWDVTYHHLRNQAGCRCIRKCDHSIFDEQPPTSPGSGNKSIITVRYENMYETFVIERLCYNVLELLCDIGGNSGLCIGVSMLHLFQFAHACLRLKKKQKNQFKLTDPLYKRVQETYNAWLQKVQRKKQSKIDTISTNPKSKLGIATIILCSTLFLLSAYNRLSYYLQYPERCVVEIAFNTTLQLPSIILCPGNEVVMNLQKEVSKSKNLSNACSVNLWELFDLPAVNASSLWRNHEIFKGNRSSMYPLLPFVDGTCLAVNKANGGMSPFEFWKIHEFLAPQCGTNYLKIYVQASTGFIEYNRYEHLVNDRFQQMLFMYKEIDIQEVKSCFSATENEQCITQCLNRKLFIRIQCRLPYMPETELPLCQTSASARHSHLTYQQLFMTPGNTEDCNCLPKCRKRILEWKLFVSSSKVVGIRFFVSASHSIVESYVYKRAYTIVKLLCDLGGLLGSTLGLSLLGMIQPIASLLAARLVKCKSD